MTDPSDPAEALAAIRRSQAEVHRRVAGGGWRYDVVYSAICAAMVGTQVLDLPLNTLGVALGVIALTLLFRRESERLGVTVTGLTPKHARGVAIGLGLAILPLMLAAIVLNRKAPSPEILVMGGAGLAVAAFVLALAGSRLWRRVYRREHGIDR